MTTKTPPTMTIAEVPIDELRPDPANPRRISDAQLEALTRSLKEYGFVQPVLARGEDRTVIGGHQRLVAARRLGYKTVPVIFLDLTVEQARVLNLGLNKISGEWDNELLARLLADLKPIEDIDLSLSGFSEDELDKLLKSLDARDKKDRVESFDLDAALEAARAAPRAQPGEIWALGDHRLLCAATQPTQRPWRASWTARRLRWPSPTLPTTSPSATTAAGSAASAGAASRTTPCRRSSGRPSSGPGRATSSLPSTAPSTSA